MRYFHEIFAKKDAVRLISTVWKNDIQLRADYIEGRSFRTESHSAETARVSRRANLVSVLKFVKNAKIC